MKEKYTTKSSEKQGDVLNDYYSHKKCKKEEVGGQHS